MRCRLASPPPPATALNESAGSMKLSVYTRMTCDADKAVDDSSLRTVPRSSMLASRVSRCSTVPGWYPAPTPAAAARTALAAVSVTLRALARVTGTGPAWPRAT